MAMKIAYMMSTLRAIFNNTAFCLSISRRFVTSTFVVGGTFLDSAALLKQPAAKLQVKDELKEREI